MRDVVAGGDESIRDQPAMALPPQGFGTHDRDATLVCERNQCIECRAELRRLHVVGVAAKGGDTPAGVARVLPRGASAAEVRHPAIRDAELQEKRLELIAREVR